MKKFCVIGHPIEHSRSPQLHQAGFTELDIEADFTKVDVKPSKLKEFLNGKFREEFAGAAVTIPHKIEIMKHLDEINQAAQQIGAVNTIINQAGKLIGTNTDGLGAYQALQTTIDPKEQNILIVGAGGASRAIIFALKQAGAHVTIVNRTTETAVQLAEEFGVEAAETLKAIDPEAFKIIINTTSVGMKEWKSPLDESFWSPHHVAFDIVYEPLETKFLFDATEAGAQTITGDKMLVHQAIAQFKLWHDLDLDPEIMERAFFE